MPKRALTASLLLFAAAVHAQHVRYVDPFMGADGAGHVFPGATLPFSMMKAGPDTGDSSANAGWTRDESIQGFSQTHVSGTGGGAKYGNILVQPTSGPLDVFDHASPRSHEAAAPGRYSVQLTRYGVGVEIAATEHAALYRFRYRHSDRAHLLFDVAHCLSSYASQHEDQRTTAAEVRVLSATEITGSSSVTGGWNAQTDTYTVYFYARVDQPSLGHGTWLARNVQAGARDASQSGAEPIGAWLDFDLKKSHVIQMKIGISFVSAAAARAHVLAELPSFDFEAVKARGTKVWERALSPLSITCDTQGACRQFYSALYRTMLMPVDVTGENARFTSTEPAYDDFYAIWDTFRTSSPLLTLVAPHRQSAIVRSLVDLYRHEGWLPDARSGGFNGRVQGGTDADIVLADAFLKHLPGIDWETAYAAMRHDSMTTSPQPLKQGRGDLEDWKRLGYLSMEGSDRPVSKGMEYAADDFATALVALGLEHTDDARLFTQRAGNWKNFWKADACDNDVCGFVWSRHRDGTWKQPFDALRSGTWGSDGFYEGNPWTYSTYVPQDVAGLIALSGGAQTFVARMDAFFAVKGRYDVGNEPGFLAPYLYLWADRPDRTETVLHGILQDDYHDAPDGLPGNDDSGAMSSWYIFGKLGFYPLAGQDVYLMGAPSFRRATLRLPNGRTLTLETDSDPKASPYIRSATWNGHPWTQSWFTHEQLLGGGTLRFHMEHSPSSWASQASTPPSMSNP